MTDSPAPDVTAADTAVARMQARARMESADRPSRTVARVVDAKADDIVDTARRGEPVEHFGQPRVRAARYTLGSGPVCDVTIVFDAEGGVDYAVIDYSEGMPRAFRVIADRDAELLYEALRRYED